MTWIDLRPGWRDDLALTVQALGMRFRTLHLVHPKPCPKGWAFVSVTRLAEVLQGCTCSSLRFRSLPF